MSSTIRSGIDQQLSGAFIAFGVLVGAAFLLTALSYGIGATWLTPELERSRQAERAENASFAAMIDEETGLRGYLMTRDLRFLEPYVYGDSKLRQADEALIADTGAGPELATSMISTRLAEQRWSESWAAAAAETRPGAVPPAMLAGQTLFDAYRREQAAFAIALQRQTERLARRGERLMEARVFLELDVFIAVLLLAVRQHRALREAVVTPVAALLLHIRCIRDGQLGVAAARPAPRELAELAQGLNELVRALATARESSVSRDEALSEHAIRLHQILDASREFSESLNLSYVVGSVRESTATIGGYEKVVVWLMDDDQKRLVDGQETRTLEASDASSETGHTLAERAAKSGRTTFEGPAGQVRFSDGGSGEVRAIAIPLIVGARVVGVLEARNTEARLATRDVLEVLEMLAAHAATAIEFAPLHEVIEERSQVDALTRLFNRRRLEDDLKAECTRSARYERPLAFVMLDVDHFKVLNDTHGHPKADTALQTVADVITGCVRTTDTAYRYGGEEFCIVLRETNAEDAMHFAERLRQRIEQRFEMGDLTGITASFGVAEFSAATPSSHVLVEAADAAMYESKHAGRNRVTLSPKLSSVSELLTAEACAVVDGALG